MEYFLEDLKGVVSCHAVGSRQQAPGVDIQGASEMVQTFSCCTTSGGQCSRRQPLKRLRHAWRIPQASRGRVGLACR